MAHCGGICSGANMEHETFDRERHGVGHEAASDVTRPFWICELCSMGEMRAIDSSGSDDQVVLVHEKRPGSGTTEFGSGEPLMSRIGKCS